MGQVTFFVIFLKHNFFLVLAQDLQVSYQEIVSITQQNHCNKQCIFMERTIDSEAG